MEKKEAKIKLNKICSILSIVVLSIFLILMIVQVVKIVKSSIELKKISSEVIVEKNGLTSTTTTFLNSSGKYNFTKDKQNINCDTKYSLCDMGDSSDFEDNVLVKSKEEFSKYVLNRIYLDEKGFNEGDVYSEIDNYKNSNTEMSKNYIKFSDYYNDDFFATHNLIVMNKSLDYGEAKIVPKVYLDNESKVIVESYVEKDRRNTCDNGIKNNCQITFVSVDKTINEAEFYIYEQQSATRSIRIFLNIILKNIIELALLI